MHSSWEISPLGLFSTESFFSFLEVKKVYNRIEEDTQKRCGGTTWGKDCKDMAWERYRQSVENGGWRVIK